METARPPAAPMPASAQSNPVLRAVTCTIVAGVLAGLTGLVARVDAWTRALPAGTSEPLGLRSIDLAEAAPAPVPRASATTTVAACGGW